MKIVNYKNNRFAIANNKGKITHTANGYGYKTYENAQKALWFFENENLLKNNSKQIVEWWESHHNIYDNIIDDIWVESDKCREDLSDDHIKTICERYDFSDAPFDNYTMFKLHDLSYKLNKRRK